MSPEQMCLSAIRRRMVCSMGRFRRPVLISGLALIGAVAALVIFTGGGSRTPAAQAAGPAENFPPLGDAAFISVGFGLNPMGDAGRKITYRELAAGAPSIPLPHSRFVGPASAGSVWTTTDRSLRNGGGVPWDKGHGIAAWVYYPASGIELSWFPYGHSFKPRRRVDGVPAFVFREEGETVTAQGEPTAVSTANVELAVGNHGLTLWGLRSKVSLKELIDVAKTLTPAPSSVSP